MFEKQRSYDDYIFDDSRSPVLNQFMKFVFEHRGDPEFDAALYRCGHKWRNEIGYVGLRFRIVDLASQGVPLVNIAKQLEVDVKTVKAWLTRFMEHGMEGLQDKPRSGRPPKKEKQTAPVKTTKARKTSKTSKPRKNSRSTKTAAKSSSTPPTTTD